MAAPTNDPIRVLASGIEEALAVARASEGGDARPQAVILRDLLLRTKKLGRAWGRPQAVGLFGPSQAGKSFLVGAMLSHEQGSLEVRARGRTLDFLKEVNPNKGVESTGVVTRFTAKASPPERGDFSCRLLPLEVVVASFATGFLVECTAPSIDATQIAESLASARQAGGPEAPSTFADAWDAVLHDLVKRYQDRHPYLNELRRSSALMGGDWKRDVRSLQGWLIAYSLLWGGPSHAPDLSSLARELVHGLAALGYAEAVDVDVDHVRASSDKPSILDAACLNSLGKPQPTIRVRVSESGREVNLDPAVLAALISEVVLPLAPQPGSLLERADLLDFPGGRALKGINGFGPKELATGNFEHAVEVYKRGKLTFLFEEYAMNREITALVLCSPGPTKPEAIQLQSQVESWLQVRYGDTSPKTPDEIEAPSLFLALTKFDMSLGSLRSDNAKDRWDSRVQEACIDFWTRGAGSWTNHWGGRGRPFANLFWIRNPFADQMLTLKPGDADYESVKAGYFQSQAVLRHFESKEEKWAAVEGNDAETGLPRSGVPLLSSKLRTKLAVDRKAIELAEEARSIQGELTAVLRALTPSRDDAEAQARLIADARSLAGAVEAEMGRALSGSVFGELVATLTMPEDALLREVNACLEATLPLSIKASDKVKRLLVTVLKAWEASALERFRASGSRLPAAQVETFAHTVCTSKLLLPVLGVALFPYFSRSQVSAELICEIIRVKIADAMVSLLSTREKKEPPRPLRLSYSEAAGTPGQAAPGEGIDWSDVDWGEGAKSSKAKAASIVFAGNRFFVPWKDGLPDFYVKSGRSRAGIDNADPRVLRLVDVLKQIESLHVG